LPVDSFKEFAPGQLGALPELRARAMFGAHGLYSGEKFFGILDEGRLFFKTDAASAADYTSRGMGAFTYESKGKRLTMAYHESAAGRAGKCAGTHIVGAAGDPSRRQFREIRKANKTELNSLPELSRQR